MELKTQKLDKKHKKEDFNCGQSILDNYLKRQANQDKRRDLSACFVLPDENNEVIGYYTLSTNSIKRDEFDEELIKKLPPSYKELPTILLGRLAVDKKHQGKKIGEFLLMEAFQKCIQSRAHFGILAIVVEPIDEKAQKFYSSYGFEFLPGSRKMFITMKTIESAFALN